MNPLLWLRAVLTPDHPDLPLPDDEHTYRAFAAIAARERLEVDPRLPGLYLLPSQDKETT